MCTLRSRLIWTSLLILLVLAEKVSATDIAREIRAGNEAAGYANGGYLELGFAALAYDFPVKGLTDESKGLDIGLALNGYYEWNRLFVEAMTESERGLILGYSLGGTDTWQLDIVMSNQHDELSEDNDDSLDGLRDREMDFMLGVRSTHYLGKSIAQLEYLTDISDVHNGWVINASLGKFWQVRNWNLHSILKLQHRSEDIVDYYLGVRENEATPEFPYYKADAGNEFGLEFGLTYPLNEKWVLRSTAQFYKLSSEMSDSPLAESENGVTWLTSASRVFR